MYSFPQRRSCNLLMPRFGPSALPLGGPRGGMAPGKIGSSGKPSSVGSGIGGSSVRRSSNVVLSESRRFCSAALCDDLRRTGDARDDEARVLELYTFPADARGISLIFHERRYSIYRVEWVSGLGSQVRAHCFFWLKARKLPYLSHGRRIFPWRGYSLEAQVHC